MPSMGLVDLCTHGKIQWTPKPRLIFSSATRGAQGTAKVLWSMLPDEMPSDHALLVGKLTLSGGDLEIKGFKSSIKGWNPSDVEAAAHFRREADRLAEEITEVQEQCRQLGQVYKSAIKDLEENLLSLGLDPAHYYLLITKTGSSSRPATAPRTIPGCCQRC